MSKAESFLAALVGEPGWPETGAVHVATRDASGDTPLHAALWARDTEAALALITAGADVNAIGEEGYTPLHVAIAQENVEAVRALATHGASWHIASQLGPSAVAAAGHSANPDLRAMAQGYQSSK